MSFFILWIEGPLTQEVEYLPFKQRVAGSSPVRPTIVYFGVRNKELFLDFLFPNPLSTIEIEESPSSSQAKDIGLSRRQQGFKSPWGHHELNQGVKLILNPFVFC